MKTNLVLASTIIVLLLAWAAFPVAALQVISRSPYLGAIVVDAATGRVLAADNPDARAYPASVTKLMTMLVILDAVDAHQMSLNEPVKVTAAAAKIGGSQVYLRQGEVFSVDELLYALAVESANDAAMALAIHCAGTKEAFVELMNRRAQQIGMRSTAFRSVHGLPPGKGQLPDVSTPRDIAKLCRELLKKPRALRYTSAKRHVFRAEAPQPFMLVNHNKLLKSTAGCDGLKTGYFRAAGYSIAATATRGGKRAIAVVLGSTNAKVRNTKAKHLLLEGLDELAATAPAPAAAAAQSSSR